MTTRLHRAARAALLFVLGGALCAVPSAAQARELQYELGAFGGGFFISGSNGLGRYSGDTADNAIKNTGELGVRLGFIVHPYVSLEGELMVAPSGTNKTAPGLSAPTAVTIFGFRAHLLVHLLTGRVRPFLLAGGGTLTDTSALTRVIDSDTDGEVHFGAGLKVDLNKAGTFGIRGDARLFVSPAITGGPFTENFEAMVGFYGLIPGNGKKVVVLPPPPEVKRVVDTDGDGVPDDQDRCPTVKGDHGNGGCPDTDGDKDGIVDRLDLCPTEAGPVENNGCPDKDSDGDGVVDRLDKCPGEKGLAELGGCPDPDSDGDGIPDRQDKCPKEPETKNGFQDEDGCPDEVPAAVKKLEGRLGGVTFATGKALLSASSEKVLAPLAKTLQEYPSVRIEISGHTSDTGKHDANVALSQARADAVKGYFVKQGIDGARLKAVGFGPDKPVVNAKTKAARAQNQRVEIRVLQAGE